MRGVKHLYKVVWLQHEGPLNRKAVIGGRENIVTVVLTQCVQTFLQIGGLEHGRRGVNTADCRGHQALCLRPFKGMRHDWDGGCVVVPGDHGLAQKVLDVFAWNPLTTAARRNDGNVQLTNSFCS